MTTRFTAQSQSSYGVLGLPSGYDTKARPTLTIPSCGIDDMERSLFNLFDKEIPFTVSNNGVDQRRVPVIFSAGEKWALLKRKKAMRDKNNSLILPLITVVRTTIEQSAEGDIAGRGINQQTGEIIVRRRLDVSDRSYQALINRLFLTHQQNLAISPLDNPDAGQVTTDRTVGELALDPNIAAGALLMPDRFNNVYETIVIPSPQFYSATYEVTIWAQYTSHMNQIIETLISSFLPQGNAWKIQTDKGYWFIATVDANTYTADTNLDDMSQEERTIKYKFNLKVPAYIFATSSPGTPIPLKRYVSSPIVTFDIGTGEAESTESSLIDEPFLGADDPTLPIDDSKNSRLDQRRTGRTRLFVNPQEVDPHDPALTTMSRGGSLGRYKRIVTMNSNGTLSAKYVKVATVNKATGETVYASGTDFGGLKIVVIDD